MALKPKRGDFLCAQQHLPPLPEVGRRRGLPRRDPDAGRFPPVGSPGGVRRGRPARRRVARHGRHHRHLEHAFRHLQPGEPHRLLYRPLPCRRKRDRGAPLPQKTRQWHSPGPGTGPSSAVVGGRRYRVCVKFALAGSDPPIWLDDRGWVRERIGCLASYAAHFFLFAGFAARR